ncbi:caspase family protein (plasmid) [Embleya sp. NBC_00888]|uniref:hypothetical protein n=1 Tax=Embleya sp. NBC_00888 TaxID=2975960 RepID=UPI002F906D25|nr:caspase family protein [Embleya sp. NBC_00888]
MYTIDGGRGSRIHALVVGVGAYPHCGSAVSEEASPWSLLHSVDEVLTCAPLSATHVARWLIEADWSKSDVKLGTVDVLLSSKFAVHWPKDLPHPVPEQAVYDNVRAAWRRWVASCDQAEDNIALLYFCGHGWGGDAQRYLLVEDLAEDIVDWKTRLIDFTRTRRSMRACKALTQCFFLDTCSDQPDELGDWACDLSAPDLIADAPQAARRTQERLDTRVHNPVFTPTPRGFPSNVDPGNVTPFADALVRTLDGLGADTAGASWVVRTTELRGRFADVLRWYWPTPPSGDALSGELPDSGRDTVLRRLSKAPKVPFRLDCHPGSARSHAKWELQCHQTSSTYSHGPGRTDKWDSETRASAYELTVRFDDGVHETLTQPGKIIYPPSHDETVEIDLLTPSSRRAGELGR